jgi:peptidoglycan/LPS O-acetylase OafA/YrhL
LRAIAVLAVVVNHMQSSALRGGFAGVDIFFVISGYLIGKHLLEDIQAGRFSFWEFYGRRARRLLPALLVMLAAVWGLGWMMLSAPNFAELGKHIAAAALFANNMLLWSQSGYFDEPAAAKPLLHLWSLGVEEQFYLLVPFLIWLSSVGRRASIRWVLRLSAISLLLTVIYPAPSFFLLDTRFWELGAGVAIGYLSLVTPSVRASAQPLAKAHRRELVAFGILFMLATALVYLTRQDPWNRCSLLGNSGLVALLATAVVSTLAFCASREPGTWNRLLSFAQRHDGAIRETASLAGAALICASLVTITSIAWPGPQTVFPVLGTALVIMAGPTASANKLFAVAPLVFIGGISYPLYLWHWPAMVFWILFGFDTSSVGLLIPVLYAALLAWITKECIEKPLRFGKLGAWTFRLPRVGIGVAGLLIVGAVGASTFATDGYPGRLPPRLLAIASLSMPNQDRDWRPNRCFFREGATDEFAAECKPTKRLGIPQILLWGDSHAGHLYPGLSNLHPKYEFDLVQWTSANCPPVRTPLLGEDSACPQRRAMVLDGINQIAPDTVLLSAAWERYLSNGNSEEAILAATQDDIVWLKGKGIRHIILFGPQPIWSTSGDIFTYMLRKRLEQVPERLGGVTDVIRHFDDAMAAQAAAAQVEYVSVVNIFCDPDGCLLVGDASLARPDLLYRDQHHFTASGSRFLMDAAAPQIFGLH